MFPAYSVKDRNSSFNTRNSTLDWTSVAKHGCTHAVHV